MSKACAFHCSPSAGQEGGELQRHARERTEALVPQHQYVPWVTVNGVAILDDFENVVKYVCVAYTGDRCARLQLQRHVVSLGA